MKRFLQLRDLGRATVWELSEAADRRKKREAALRGTTPVLLFAENAPEERLALTASVRAAGGEARWFGPGEWSSDAPPILPAGDARALYLVRGLDREALLAGAFGDAPVLHCGGPDGHPCRVLADLSLICGERPDIQDVRIAWVGGAGPLAHSLIEAALLLPFELFMALPEWGEPDRELLGLALAAGAKIFLTRDAHMALDGAHYVYAGKAAPDTGELQAGMTLDKAALAPAAPEVCVFLGAEGARVEKTLLEQHIPAARRRFASRLRIQRRVWDMLRGESGEG